MNYVIAQTEIDSDYGQLFWNKEFKGWGPLFEATVYQSMSLVKDTPAGDWQWVQLPTIPQKTGG